ncbi:thermosome subunit, partial [Candidatus Bathyarchaeota archaeon]|nr:thermosome subunit [Candidatus Bathyarchaeota archaeon]NIR17050.1 thermosome subunit [Desulfobacterales bacterium]NIU80977.1 thermosome subunit [Candidatus Bathyarchaeota archaeon]NIV68086.1 thermosome subunit [Candidatus Bathyarchaeota archaeon]NIW16048.1 thermosome subunit [Candidatus Bathyarchaeota archaeon]
IAIAVEPQNRTSLEKVAMTAMASKLVAENRKHLAEIATSAVLKVAQQIEGEYRVDLDDIIVQKKAGKSLTDTKMINGLVVDKEIVNPGMPKRIQDGKIALLAAPLEVEKTEFDAKINIERPEQIDAFRQQEK